MQFKLICLFLFVGVCFGQISNRYDDEQEFISTVSKEISKMQYDTLTSLLQFTQQLDSLKLDFKELLFSIVAHFQQKLGNSVSQGTDMIDYFKKLAIANGQDPSKCLSGIETKLGNIYVKYYIQGRENTLAEEYKLLDLINNSSQTAKNTFDDIQKLPEELEACGNDIGCVIGVRYFVKRLQKDISTKMDTQIRDIHYFVQTGANNTLQISFGRYYKAAELKSILVAEDFYDCLNKL